MMIIRGSGMLTRRVGITSATLGDPDLWVLFTGYQGKHTGHHPWGSPEGVIFGQSVQVRAQSEINSLSAHASREDEWPGASKHRQSAPSSFMATACAARTEEKVVQRSSGTGHPRHHEEVDGLINKNLGWP